MAVVDEDRMKYGITDAEEKDLADFRGRRMPCMVTSPEGYLCSRSAGHGAGRHIAGSDLGTRIRAVWPVSEDDEPSIPLEVIIAMLDHVARYFDRAIKARLN